METGPNLLPRHRIRCAGVSGPVPCSRIPDGALDSLRSRVEGRHRDCFRPWQEWAIEHFRGFGPDVRVVMLGETRHTAMPWQRRDTILTEIRQFLGGIGEG